MPTNKPQLANKLKYDFFTEGGRYTSEGLLHAEKRAEADLLYAFKITFPAPPLQINAPPHPTWRYVGPPALFQRSMSTGLEVCVLRELVNSRHMEEHGV